MTNESHMNVIARVDPQPPKGISYMLGNESWLPAHERGLIRLHVEEWGNLGPMELNPSIKRNKAGFRVRCTTIIAPPGVFGSIDVDGVEYWTDKDVWTRTEADVSRCVDAVRAAGGAPKETT